MGVDSRIKDWFAEKWAEAQSRFEAKYTKWMSEQNAVAKENSERAELQRLKAKYESHPRGEGEESK